MEFSMINAGLAAGAALAALPVILHLFMRQTPKHVIFPALRLVRERQKRSKKRLRVKNWLLLLARMAVLALMALALARPRLYSQMPLGDQSVPTALGLVFDTSLSMSYKEKDKTRLDEAKERALAILDQIPDSSLVFPVNSADPVAPYGLTPAAARQWIDNLTIRPVNRLLNSAMGQVYPKVVECDRPRHEVYVLTDLARSSWNPEQPAEGLDRVAKAKTTPGGKIATFILRLGSREVNDVAIDSAAPAKNFVTQGESVEIKGQVRAQGTKPASRVVEFYLDGVKKGEKPVEVPPGGQVEVSFATPTRLPEGEMHRGELRLGRHPRSARIQRQALLHVQGAAGLQGAAHRRPESRRRLRGVGSRSRPVTLGLQRLSDRQGAAERLAGAVSRHAQGLCRGLRAQRRNLRGRGFLGPAQRLCARGRGAGLRAGRPLQPRELQRPDGKPDPARPARAEPTLQGRDHLRQDRRRHSSPFSTLCRGHRSPACPGARLPLLVCQAAGRFARPPELRRRLLRRSSSERSRAPRPGGSCSGPLRCLAVPGGAIEGHGTNSPCRLTRRSWC